MKLAAILLTILLTAPAGEACTFQWDAVHQHTDNSPLDPGEVVQYKLFFTPEGATVAHLVSITPALTLTQPCLAGTYYVGASSSSLSNTDSEGSNTVIRRSTSLKQLKSPRNFKVLP